MFEPDPHRAHDHRAEPAPARRRRGIACLNLGERGGGRQFIGEPLGVNAGLGRERFDPRQGVALCRTLRHRLAPRA
ncbi:MAG: hypothetical protein E6J90_04230 [Deltaproteobacteria bacterium]|nr:MAG: hypothetical protein E6J91_31440 [Deltaproteobacteria bacterium]TMQ26559.1 MAG: hypothetical protein E6J90_04230 [Deltaproteobacteria bacterium]